MNSGTEIGAIPKDRIGRPLASVTRSLSILLLGIDVKGRLRVRHLHRRFILARIPVSGNRGRETKCVA